MACSINIDQCSITLDDIINFDDINIPTSIENEDYQTKLKEIKQDNIKFITDALEEQWKKQRLTGDDVATAFAQLLPTALSGSIDDLIKIKTLPYEEAKLRLEVKRLKLQAIQELLNAKATEQQILESKERTNLYKAQAEGYRDKVKIEAVKIVTNGWTTIYTQNQALDIPDSFRKVGNIHNIDDTLKDLFNQIGLNDPTT